VAALLKTEKVTSLSLGSGTLTNKLVSSKLLKIKKCRFRYFRRFSITVIQQKKKNTEV